MPSIDFVVKMATDIYGNHNPKIDQVIRHALIERINGFCAGANFECLQPLWLATSALFTQTQGNALAVQVMVRSIKINIV